MLPLDNATCERGFSLLNYIKDKRRNRLGDSMLFDLMILGKVPEGIKVFYRVLRFFLPKDLRLK